MEPLIGQCPYCGANLTNGHFCFERARYNFEQLMKVPLEIRQEARRKAAGLTDYSPEPCPYLDPDTLVCKHPDIPFYDIICSTEVCPNA